MTEPRYAPHYTHNNAPEEGTPVNDDMILMDASDVPDVGRNANEAVCGTLFLTYNASLSACPHHYDQSEACK